MCGIWAFFSKTSKPLSQEDLANLYAKFTDPNLQNRGPDKSTLIIY